MRCAVSLSSVKSLIQGAPNPKTEMILISSCSRLCPIHWSHVLSREWRYSWSSADRRCSKYIWVINNLIANSGAPYIRDLTVYILVKMIMLGKVRLHSLCQQPSPSDFTIQLFVHNGIFTRLDCSLECSSLKQIEYKLEQEKKTWADWDVMFYVRVNAGWRLETLWIGNELRRNYLKQ